MKNAIQVFIVGTFVAVIAVIIFVRAGQKTSVSGGQQASQIISAAGDSYGKAVSSLTGG